MSLKLGRQSTSRSAAIALFRYRSPLYPVAPGGRETLATTTIRLGRKAATFEAVALDDLTTDVVRMGHAVRFVQTTGGRTAVFTAEVGGSGPFTYEWRRSGVIVGTGGSLLLPSVTAADAGDYTVTVRNALGAATSPVARLTVDGTPALANLSTRATVGPGDRALIAGFVVRGATAKQLVVRGVGPGLVPLGVAGVLPNPVLTLYDSTNRVLATNDRWSPAATPASLFAGLGAFPLADGSADAALRIALPPGNYTAVIADAAGRTGAGLVEIYEADATTDRLVNLSTRAFVGADANLVIAGFVVRGERPARYLIRGVGPALAAFGVTGALAELRLTLRNEAGTILAGNDRWGANANAAELALVATRLGAFPLAPASKDAALLITLSPGTYTVSVSAANGASGIALAEIFEVP